MHPENASDDPLHPLVIPLLSAPRNRTKRASVITRFARQAPLREEKGGLHPMPRSYNGLGNSSVARPRLAHNTLYYVGQG